MKTMRNIQIAITAVSLLVAIRLADSVCPTTNELIGSVALMITGGTSLWCVLVENERQAE